MYMQNRNNYTYRKPTSGYQKGEGKGKGKNKNLDLRDINYYA